jgi:hypothetical protein
VDQGPDVAGHVWRHLDSIAASAALLR